MLWQENTYKPCSAFGWMDKKWGLDYQEFLGRIMGVEWLYRYFKGGKLWDNGRGRNLDQRSVCFQFAASKLSELRF